MADPESKNPVEKIAAEAEHPMPAVKAAIAPRRVRSRRALVFQIYTVGAVLAFAVLAFFASFTNYWPVDLAIMLAVQSIQFAPFDWVMRFLTLIGFAPQVLILWALISLYI